MKNYGIHLLVLSHVFSMPKLKQRCTVDLIQFMTTGNVVDVLHLAKLCDAPNLYFKCVKLVTNNFEAVKETEGWKLLHKHDPCLEVDLIRLNKEQESRKKRGEKHREEQKLFVQLSEAVQCLKHICTEGCTNVASYDVEITGRPCTKFSTCQALQGLIKHFTTCDRRLERGCRSCKSMWKLFRLHSCICINQEACKVPLCKYAK
ncbi:putative histone acetyltransferase transcription factor and/or regulators TAZ family [Medicago truncatula]|uniref:Putative histone acetyltransferase transcription factor and/or regulators TAZ family n=1 Tax=Medicago truncatula TaxID=3880 RepID=A0A396ISK6_MEDTR|nr:putative histone acetyltransferase transcription factor and/or regulators TAZ family [Medicago truncatula]